MYEVREEGGPGGDEGVSYDVLKLRPISHTVFSNPF